VEIIAWHQDEDQSGGTQNRPGIREAIARIEAGETEGIACWRLNRFARNVAGAIGDVQKIQALGGHLAFVQEDIDPTGAFGSFVLTVLLAVATLERDNISESWKTAKTRAVERGAFIGPVPIGYVKDENGVLVPSEYAPAVREAFREAGQAGIRAAMDLLREQVPVRKWHNSSAVRNMLASRAYLGENVYGDIVNREAHEAIVTLPEWEAAQIQPGKKRASRNYPLSSGVVVCAGCKQSMVGSTGSSGDMRLYRCKTQATERSEITCPEPASVAADRLENHVKLALRRVWVEGGAEVADVIPGDLSAQERALEEAEAELSAFASDLSLRSALGNDYHAMLDLRVKARDAAKATYQEAAKANIQAERVITQDMLDSDLGAAASIAFERIEVKRGKGGSLDDRVRFFKRRDVPMPPAEPT
jgi:DNA invertase Pin-like site-specific DNA recombinase